MTVAFGKPQTAWYGNTKLTKAINKGGFGIATSLDLGKVQDAAVQTCKDFPVKQAKLVRTPMKPLIMTRKGVEVIAYGLSDVNKTTGKEQVFGRSWELALGEGTGNYRYRILLTYAKLYSGKISEVEELQYFLNELEGNLRHLDPQATIELLAEL